MIEYPCYRADGVWAQLLDLRTTMRHYGADGVADYPLALDRLADRLELLDDPRARDFAALLYEIAAVFNEWPDEEPRPDPAEEEGAAAAAATADRPEAWDEDEPLAEGAP